MPRKTKEQKDLKNKENNVKTSTTNIKKTYNSTFSVICMADSFQKYLEFALNK